MTFNVDKKINEYKKGGLCKKSNSFLYLLPACALYRTTVVTCTWDNVY